VRGRFPGRAACTPVVDRGVLSLSSSVRGCFLSPLSLKVRAWWAPCRTGGRERAAMFQRLGLLAPSASFVVSGEGPGWVPGLAPVSVDLVRQGAVRGRGIMRPHKVLLTSHACPIWAPLSLDQRWL